MRDPERLDYENEEAKNFKFNVVAVTPNGQEVRSAIEVKIQISECHLNFKQILACINHILYFTIILFSPDTLIVLSR